MILLGHHWHGQAAPVVTTPAAVHPHSSEDGTPSLFPTTFSLSSPDHTGQANTDVNWHAIFTAVEGSHCLGLVLCIFHFPSQGVILPVCLRELAGLKVEAVEPNSLLLTPVKGSAHGGRGAGWLRLGRERAEAFQGQI